VYVLCKIVARSRYHYCSGSGKMPSVCVVEMHVAVNCINILGVVHQCCYGKFNVIRS